MDYVINMLNKLLNLISKFQQKINGTFVNIFVENYLHFK